MEIGLGADGADAEDKAQEHHRPDQRIAREPIQPSLLRTVPTAWFLLVMIRSLHCGPCPPGLGMG